jgi:5-methylcytosine-specific restriction endonuclease McrA
MSVKWDISKLEDAVKTSFCYADVCRKIGLDIKGRNYDTIRNWITNLKLDTSHFKTKGQLAKERSFVKTPRTDNEIFSINSVVKRSVVKTRLKQLIPYVCAICSLADVWNENLLVLHLDHINGNSSDNRRENLRFLCPNCHSQTGNYAGKNSRKKPSELNPDWRKNDQPKRRKVVRPSKEELKILLDSDTFVAIGKKFGVSDNAVRKWAKRYKLM